MKDFVIHLVSLCSSTFNQLGTNKILLWDYTRYYDHSEFVALLYVF